VSLVQTLQTSGLQKNKTVHHGMINQHIREVKNSGCKN